MKLWPGGQPDNWVWKPTTRDIARAWIGIAGMFVLLASYTYWFPSASHTGRWAWLHNMAAAAFGRRGDVVLYSIIAIAFLFFGVRKYRSQSDQDVA